MVDVPTKDIMEPKLQHPSRDLFYLQIINNSEKVGNGSGRFPSASGEFNESSDATLFSSSLPVLPHEQLNFTDSGVKFGGDNSSKLREKNAEGEDSGEEIGISRGIGNLLPDDENDLLAGVMDDFDLSELPTQMEDLEEYDIFNSGGGMEMDYDPQEKLTVAMVKLSANDGYCVNGAGHYGLTNGVGTIAGEHPYGEHPSRTLFVRNINSNVDDLELRSLFEQYGAIRTLYTTCKHRGFVMISYYDIRDARTAMRALQNKPLRRRKLDIHFSIPKDNPSDKDINQGTLVVFNLDPSVSNDDLLQIFGAYGEVKEIRETPHKRHHKFIEFYDVRAAEAALRSLNRSDIAGKRIKLEPSRPGGARRNLINQLSQELDQDETRSFLHHVGSPVTTSPPGHWAQLSSPTDNTPVAGFSHSPSLTPIGPMSNNQMSGLASILSPTVSNSATIAPIGKDQGHSDQVVTSTRGHLFQQSHSFPGPTNDMKLSMSPNSGAGSSFGLSDSSTSGINTLTGSQFLWGSPTLYSECGNNANWTKPSIRPSFASNGQRQSHGFSYSSRHGSLPHHFHVGSAPAPFAIPLERQYDFYPESPDTSFVNSATHGYGSQSLNRVESSFMATMGSRATTNHGVPFSGTMSESLSPNFRLMSSPRPNHVFLGGAGPYLGMLAGSGDGFSDRYRNRRVENQGSQIDSKKLFQLDIDKIAKGEDKRTTLMIKNIPNKYTSKMLLTAIDENHRGTFDFLYLPIDFKNKCNVGYAFINMISPSHIIPFYQAFNGKKWEKFNSEKVASLAYARIQGKTALVAHFQNSSLMNEDKRCRPLLFHYDGLGTGDQIIPEPFPSNDLNSSVLKQESFQSSEDFSESSVKDSSDNGIKINVQTESI